MAKQVFKINLPGLNELMKSPEMQSVLNEKGQEVASKAKSMSTHPDAEYRVRTKAINWIAVTNVSCDNDEALLDNLENNTLIKALGQK